MAERTANLLGALALAVTDRMEAVARDNLGHSGETPAALVIIGYEPGLSNDRLRRVLRLSHPGTVRLVDRLVADGLVERRPGRDGRAVALHLTAAGRSRRGALLRGRLAAVGEALAVLDEAEQETFWHLLHKVLAAMPRDEVEPYTICRLCDARVCESCPLPGKVD
jgi:DNA-binding MarR family transcriptional regulator